MKDQLPFKGLSDSEAAEQLTRVGHNELPQSKKENFWVRSSRLVKEPMLLLLIAAGVIYLVMGDLGEGIMLGASVFVVVGISF